MGQADIKTRKGRQGSVYWLIFIPVPTKIKRGLLLVSCQIQLLTIWRNIDLWIEAALKCTAARSHWKTMTKTALYLTRYFNLSFTPGDDKNELITKKRVMIFSFTENKAKLSQFFAS